jgi:chemotaxis signal transduction protein
MSDLVSDDFINSILDEIENLENSRVSIAEEGEYLTFNLAGEIFGVFLLKVREIVKMMPITRAAEGANRYRSFIRLRDRMIPVYDLRSLLGLKKTAYTDRTSIIIVETWHDLKLKKFGIIADSVAEVLKVTEENLVDLPELFKEMRISYLLGMAKSKERLILLLNTDKIIEKFV